MNNIYTNFTISDLENLSGIKAHTIRIWEKRYDLLRPARTGTNIRYYDIANLKKLLNVTLLYEAGHKISRIAALSEQDLLRLVREEVARSEDGSHQMSSLKLAMLNFDGSLFEHTYAQLIAERSFREIFTEVFIPLLDQIGLLWQSEAIVPAHEHFISNLIKQKLHINIERVKQRSPENNDTVFTLYLPVNEIHELGLLYIHYELILKGHHSIYLGQSVPIENLLSIKKLHKNNIFISYFTIQPEEEEIPAYLNKIKDIILDDSTDKFWIVGRKVRNGDIQSPDSRIVLFSDIRHLLDII